MRSSLMQRKVSTETEIRQNSMLDEMQVSLTHLYQLNNKSSKHRSKVSRAKSKAFSYLQKVRHLQVTQTANSSNASMITTSADKKKMLARSKKRSHLNRKRVCVEAKDNKQEEDTIECIYENEPENLDQEEDLTIKLMEQLEFGPIALHDVGDKPEADFDANETLRDKDEPAQMSKIEPSLMDLQQPMKVKIVDNLTSEEFEFTAAINGSNNEDETDIASNIPKPSFLNFRPGLLRDQDQMIDFKPLHMA